VVKISENYDIGNRDNVTPERLLEMLEDMYRDLAIAINRKPDVYVRTTDGSTTDILLSDGDLTINSSSNKVEILTKHSSPTAVFWKTLS